MKVGWVICQQLEYVWARWERLGSKLVGRVIVVTRHTIYNQKLLNHYTLHSQAGS